MCVCERKTQTARERVTERKIESEKGDTERERIRKRERQRETVHYPYKTARL